MLRWSERFLAFLLIPYGVLIGMEPKNGSADLFDKFLTLFLRYKVEILIGVVVLLGVVRFFLWRADRSDARNLLEHILGKIRAKAFEKYEGGAQNAGHIVDIPSEKTNRLTLFKAHSCLFAKDKVLKCFLRAGNTNAKSSAKFKVYSDHRKPEGIVGICYRNASSEDSVIRKQIPLGEIPKASDQLEMISNYARAFNRTEDSIKKQLEAQKLLIASIEAIPIKVKNRLWGVLVFDSADSTACYGKRSLAKEYSVVISTVEIILERL